MAASSEAVSRRKMALAASAVVLIVVLLLIEAMARLAFAYKAEVNAFLNAVGGPVSGIHLALDEYEMSDPENASNWLLRPGYRRTMWEVIEEKRTANKPLAVEHLTQRAQALGVGLAEMVIEINKDGFKGPELDPAHSKPRILAIGDSCTFGTLIDRYSYPRVMEKELTKTGLTVEVVNGGVEGYSPRNVVLYRINQFKSLRPEIATIYIGWNALYSDDASPEGRSGIGKYLYTAWMGQRIWAKLRTLARGTDDALDQYNRAKRPDRNDARLQTLRVPPSIIRDVESIVDEMQSVGSKVYLVTIPGLFATDEETTEKALRVGHLPAYTDNPYVFARLAEIYNESLRELAQRRGVGLIDLEQWSKTNVTPRDQYFFDSVHLYEEGQAKIGKYLAQVLTDPVRNVQPGAASLAKRDR